MLMQYLRGHEHGNELGHIFFVVSVVGLWLSARWLIRDIKAANAEPQTR